MSGQQYDKFSRFDFSAAFPARESDVHYYEASTVSKLEATVTIPSAETTVSRLLATNERDEVYTSFVAIIERDAANRILVHPRDVIVVNTYI